MPEQTTARFIESTLYELADEYTIPKEMIPQLIGLLEQYPDNSLRGAKKGLRDGLEQQIENIKNQGYLK